jgi:hypothetical protein
MADFFQTSKHSQWRALLMGSGKSLVQQPRYKFVSIPVHAARSSINLTVAWSSGCTCINKRCEHAAGPSCKWFLQSAFVSAKFYCNDEPGAQIDLARPGRIMVITAPSGTPNPCTNPCILQLLTLEDYRLQERYLGGTDERGSTIERSAWCSAEWKMSRYFRA